jgi:hypothetical protein
LPASDPASAAAPTQRSALQVAASPPGASSAAYPLPSGALLSGTLLSGALASSEVTPEPSGAIASSAAPAGKPENPGRPVASVEVPDAHAAPSGAIANNHEVTRMEELQVLTRRAAPILALPHQRPAASR